MTASELRKKYLDFFAAREHAVIPSASLLPENDPTTLFTSSGMQPMVPYLLGEKHPQGVRIADSQKSFRAEDIDEVGDNRHTTFFEMLGNWSLGDYFKKEQVSWVFEFVIKELGLDPKRIYVTVFRGDSIVGIPRDDEAVALWKEAFSGAGIKAIDIDHADKEGMQDGRIFYYEARKNWWSRAGVPENMPVNEPGGPDSELFWDFGEQLKLHETSVFKAEPCHVNCDCGRFLEIGNSVFMAYRKTEQGFEELPNKNIDFGGGLERMLMAVNNDPDMFAIDVFSGMRAALEDLSGKKYGADPKMDFAFRVILDHMRAAIFLIADGAVPSNKDQGYFTRRLIRRSVRFAQQLGINTSFSEKLVKPLALAYADMYPDLASKHDMIISQIHGEEEKFVKTLSEGMRRFNQLVASEKVKDRILNADDAFDLFATYGFPIEMTQELCEEQGISVDVKGFYEAFVKHQEISKAGAEKKFAGGLADHSETTTKYHTATHLLHAALRKVLGTHVEQRGSNITAERLRFDFSHPEKMTPEQVKEVERLVNAAVQNDYPVSFAEMTVAEAKEGGAMGLFESKYGEKVKVYSIGDSNQKPEANPESPTFSKEICGGPHVERTGILGTFKILKEQASSAGIRRIKAVLE